MGVDVAKLQTAHRHLHLWRPTLRRSGMGATFLAKSIDLYFERFGLKSIASEPYADNPAPNRVLTMLGFRLIRCYQTVDHRLGNVRSS